ncbi:MAG: ABC transporter permease [Chloroflexi bacterium]|jgi:ABC-2 type transport system permease protein|nr:ABC transporter permease [Chloroflexota bacterium]
MRGFWKLLQVQAKLYLREPIATFFTIFYAPLVLLLFGAIYGNKPNPFYGGRGAMDVGVPSFIGLIVVTVGLIGLPISAAAARESGVLRRFRATPLHPLAYILSDIASYLLMTLIGVLLLVLTGRAIFHIRFEGNVLSVLAGFLLGTTAFFALGYLIAGLAPTARIAQTVGMVLAFPMMFISGATIPLEVLPAKVRAVGQYIPLTHVVTLMRGLWFGDSWSQHWKEVAVLVGCLLVGGAIAARTFRWE